MEPISFVDLHAQHQEVRQEIDAALADILDTSSFIGGRYVSSFEQEFASYLGVAEAVGVSNGTDALWLALWAAGVKPGSAVITVPNTFIATVEAISRAGAYPLFVDIDLETANLDIAALQALLETGCARQDNGAVVHLASGRQVAAILPVHLYGLPADLGPLFELARQYGLPVVEDACQAHGARYRLNGEWGFAGTFGTAAAFSFYPGKNLGAIGDAGAVVTNDPALAEQMRWMREHGSSEKYVHVTSEGWNSRLDALQAAVLSIKLRRLDDWNQCRRQAAGHYHRVLKNLPLELPGETENSEHVYHLYVVRAADRDRLRDEMKSRGIDTGIHYPVPLHLQKAYVWMGLPTGSFPNAELSARTILSLPMHPMLDQAQVESIGRACADILRD